MNGAGGEALPEVADFLEHPPAAVDSHCHLSMVASRLEKSTVEDMLYHR